VGVPLFSRMFDSSVEARSHVSKVARALQLFLKWIYKE